MFRQKNRFTRLQWILIIASYILPMPCLAFHESFNLLFNSNRQEVLDRPIVCEKPLPEWLKGSLIRNGPGRFEMGTREFTHPFDGYSKLHSFKFRGNRTILFSAKFLRTAFYNKSLAEGDVAPYLLFDSVKPPFSWLNKLLSLYNGVDNTNVNVFHFGKYKTKSSSQFVAVSDFWHLYEFDPDTLNEVDTLSPPVPGETKIGPLLSSSHPVPEHGTDNYITFVTTLHPIPFGMGLIRLVRIISAKERQYIAEIPVKNVPYMHSFGLSGKYAVLFLCPVYVNQEKILETMNPLKSLEWHPEKPTTVVVVNIHTGKQFHLETENTFVMHHLNAFEVNDSLIKVDMVTYPNISIFQFLEFRSLRNPEIREKYFLQPSVKRYTIDLNAKQIRVRVVPPVGEVKYAVHLDMPVINEAYRHFEYCYVYGLTTQIKKHRVSCALSKKNMCDGLDQGWQRENEYPLEPWFVAHPNGISEDDGVLLSLVLDGMKKESYLGIFNPQTMTLINRCPLSQIVPFNIHGRFFPDI